MRADESVVFTTVELEYRAGVRNVRLIFGKPSHVVEREQSFGITRRTAYFAAGAVFALDHWEGSFIENRAGEARTRTRYRACAVLQACGVGEPMTHLARVAPGARILIRTEGVRRCKFLIGWLEELARRCDPTLLAAPFYEAKDLRVQGLIPERARPAAIGFPAHACPH